MIRETLQREGIIHKNFWCYVFEDYDGEGNQGPLHITYHKDKPCLTISCHNIGYKRHLLLYLDCLIYDIYDTERGWVVFDDFSSLTYKDRVYYSDDLKIFLYEILGDVGEDYQVGLCFSNQDRVSHLEITCLNFTFKRPTWSRDPRDNV